MIGRNTGYNTIKPIQSKVAANHILLSPPALMSFIGALKIQKNPIDKHQIILTPFNDLVHENTPWNQTSDHERPFQKLKKAFTSETTEVTLSNTKHPILLQSTLLCLD